MLLPLLLLVGWLGWLMTTGRIARPGNGQIVALLLALLGGAMVAKGQPVVGGIMAVAGLAWLSRRPRRRRPVTAAAPDVPDVRAREALDLLGLSPDADRAAVIDAHRRLIARNHPDVGGTEALARTINAARDTLLARLPTR